MVYAYPKETNISIRRDQIKEKKYSSDAKALRNYYLTHDISVTCDSDGNITASSKHKSL